MTSPKPDLTPHQVELFRRIGLLRETVVGSRVLELTWAARTLLVAEPRATQPEPIRSWLARIAPSKAEVLP